MSENIEKYGIVIIPNEKKYPYLEPYAKSIRVDFPTRCSGMCKSPHKNLLDDFCDEVGIDTTAWKTTMDSVTNMASMDFVVMCLLMNDEVAGIFVPDEITLQQKEHIETVQKRIPSYHIFLTNSKLDDFYDCGKTQDAEGLKIFQKGCAKRCKN